MNLCRSLRAASVVSALSLASVGALVACASAPAPAPASPSPGEAQLSVTAVTTAPGTTVAAAPVAPATPTDVSPAAPHGPLTAAGIAALLAAPDRSDDDRKLDDQRKADKFLAFLGVGPGMQVAEVGAGSGYTSELLARAVGPTGTVYGHNTPEILKKFAEGPWSARLGRPVNKPIVRKDAPFESPFPGVGNLDLVVNVLFYHDTVWLGVDREKMNRAVFAALRPGGAYVIVDHSARMGDGLADVKTFHRIDENVVKAELEKVGFKLEASADFLRNPADTRDWNDSPTAAGPRRGTSDRFVLKFVKPAA